MNIFAVKDDKVQIFSVVKDKKTIKNIQAKIDEWNGKGDLKEITTGNLNDIADSGEKIEIVSEQYVGKEDVFFYCCPSIEKMDMYNYKFYQYNQHPLSKLCDTLLNDYNSLDFSEHIAQLLSWSSDNNKEMTFVSELICAFEFKKISVEKIIQSDLTLGEKRNILIMIKDSIKQIQQPRKNTSSIKSYRKEVEGRIKDMESFNSGFYGRELHGKDFKYTKDEKVAIRRKILKSLPSTDLIEKSKK